MMTREMKARKRVEKVLQLEQGGRQFASIPNPERRAYVWVGNVSFPVPMSR